ncbi:MAG: EAL domain-containing protein [Firmicutes bacterium]|nr:EAL domain-containing protein [Bacillota bacterium]
MYADGSAGKSVLLSEKIRFEARADQSGNHGDSGEYGTGYRGGEYTNAFGTGYSNLSRIIDLPFRIVKIDKSMTDKVFDSKINSILKYNIRLLKEIGMDIVVEGVETEAVLKQFEEMGCDFIQGYYFSRPLPPQEFVEFVQTQERNR